MNPFEHVKAVAFELSNVCPLNHSKCPLSTRPPIQTLPSQIVIECLSELSFYGWTGNIEFNQYNEPMADPRLFNLMRIAREFLPDAIMEIETSGFNLTPELARSMASLGNVKLHVTAYEPGRETKIAWLEKEIAPLISLSIGRHELDDRMEAYTRPIQDTHVPCYEPLAFVTVTCAGKVGLCCFDWARTVTFGDLRTQSLKTILESQYAMETYEALKMGVRTLDVCRRCNRSRGA